MNSADADAQLYKPTCGRLPSLYGRICARKFVASAAYCVSGAVPGRRVLVVRGILAL